MKFIRSFFVLSITFLMAMPAATHFASFESDLPTGDSTLEDPWEIGPIRNAFDRFSYLDEGDVDYILFEGDAGEVVDHLFVIFPATLEFLPSVVIAGPGLSGGSVPDWVEVPEGMGIMNYEYFTDFLTEEAFGELEHFVVIAYDIPMEFTLPETSEYMIIVYHEDQQAGYYDIAHGNEHSVGGHAENWEDKLDQWVQGALGLTQSSVSKWELYQ